MKRKKAVIILQLHNIFLCFYNNKSLSVVLFYNYRKHTLFIIRYCLWKLYHIDEIIRKEWNLIQILFIVVEVNDQSYREIRQK